MPRADTYSLTERPGFLRLYAVRPSVIRERGRASLLGVRQRESDFEYAVQMQFAPRINGSESGLLLFQKDDNYIALAVARIFDGYMLRLVVAVPGEARSIIRETKLADYDGTVTLHIESRQSRYRLSYSLGAEEVRKEFAELPADLILSRGYTGAYLGIFAAGEGDFADFDWVRYEDFRRP